MNFTISKNEFLNALVTVSHAISTSSPKVELRGVKISVSDNQMVLTGSNADISIEKTITVNEQNQLNIIETGSLLMDVRILLDIVKKLDSATVSVEVIDGAFTKFSGNLVTFKINGMNVDDYPTIDFSKPAETITFDKKVLKDAIDQTSISASTKETRPVLTGVNFKFSNNQLVMTATDSFRLSRKTLAIDCPYDFNITIPAKTLSELKNTMLDDEGEITICLNAKKVQFIGEDMILQTRLLDGAFPDVDRLVPTTFTSTLSIDRSDFIHALDRTIFIKNDNMVVVRLQCSEDEVVLTNKSQEIGESRESLHAKYNGDALEISFSGNYAMDAARALESDQIALKFTGLMRPFIVCDEKDDSIVQLVLPVRTYN